jgi:hypothetical protein
MARAPMPRWTASPPRRSREAPPPRPLDSHHPRGRRYRPHLLMSLAQAGGGRPTDPITVAAYLTSRSRIPRRWTGSCASFVVTTAGFCIASCIDVRSDWWSCCMSLPSAPPRSRSATYGSLWSDGGISGRAWMHLDVCRRARQVATRRSHHKTPFAILLTFAP